MTALKKKAAGGNKKVQEELSALKRRIAQLEKIEKEQSGSEAKYRGLFENILEGVYQTRPNGKIMAANPALVKMLGYKSEQDLIDKATAKNLYDDPLERRRLVARLKKEGVLRNVVFRLRRKDGTYITVLENARVIRDEKGKSYHFEGVLTDITERIGTEEDLRKANEQLDAILGALPDLFFVIDKKGAIYDFRAPDIGLLAIKPEKFLHKPIKSVLPKAAANTILDSIKNATIKGSHFGSTYSLRLRGKERWFELSISALGDTRRKECRFVALVRDITERKTSQDKLRKQAQQLKAERKALEDKNNILRQLFDQISNHRLDYQSKLLRDIEQAVFPMIDRIKENSPKSFRDDLDYLAETIGSVLAKDADIYKRNFARLTSRESELCELIENGMSSKEIAEKLSISELTVAKHREKIRKKLEITGKRISLATYLRSHR